MIFWCESSNSPVSMNSYLERSVSMSSQCFSSKTTAKKYIFLKTNGIELYGFTEQVRYLVYDQITRRHYNRKIHLYVSKPYRNRLIFAINNHSDKKELFGALSHLLLRITDVFEFNVETTSANRDRSRLQQAISGWLVVWACVAGRLSVVCLSVNSIGKTMWISKMRNPEKGSFLG